MGALSNKAGEVDILMASAITHELPRKASEDLICEAARVLRGGGVFGYFDLNPVQLLRDNPVSNLTDRVAIANEPFLDEFLAFDLEESLVRNGFEVLEIRATNKAKWSEWQDCPCRIVIARKPESTVDASASQASQVAANASVKEDRTLLDESQVSYRREEQTCCKKCTLM